jgi:ABC-type uncharacterized transport system substrate-binding protein
MRRSRRSGGTWPNSAWRFRLVVNMKAARALGVRVPKAVLSRADQIID